MFRNSLVRWVGRFIAFACAGVVAFLVGVSFAISLSPNDIYGGLSPDQVLARLWGGDLVLILRANFGVPLALMGASLVVSSARVGWSKSVAGMILIGLIAAVAVRLAT